VLLNRLFDTGETLESCPDSPLNFPKAIVVVVQGTFNKRAAKTRMSLPIFHKTILETASKKSGTHFFDNYQKERI